MKETLSWLEAMRARVDKGDEAPEAMLTGCEDEGRLSLGRVEVSFRRGQGEVKVSLYTREGAFAARREFRRGGGPPDTQRRTAEAALEAVRNYLFEYWGSSEVPRLRLVECGRFRPGGEDAVYAVVALEVGEESERLLGAALERGQGFYGAAAAVLDAVNRRLPALLDHTQEEIEEAGVPSREEARQADGDNGNNGDQARENEAEDHSNVVICLAGIEVTPQEVRAGLFDKEGKMLAETRRPCLPSSLPETVVCQIVRCYRELRDHDAIAKQICGIGIALAGRFRDGVCLESADFPEWSEAPLERLLTEELNEPICLIDRAQAVHLAEARCGVGEGKRNLPCSAAGKPAALALLGAALVASEAVP